MGRIFEEIEREKEAKESKEIEKLQKEMKEIPLAEEAVKEKRNGILCLIFFVDWNGDID
jgi:hypothetical protein